MSIMKWQQAAAAFVTLIVMARAEAARGVRFGPRGCATLTRSLAGSCLFRTDCDGQDISSLDFELDCVHAEGSVVRHDFGRGGFDTVEEYDTEVKCARCRLPNAKVNVKAGNFRRGPVAVDLTPDPEAADPVEGAPSQQVAFHAESAASAGDKESKGEGTPGSLKADSKVVKYGPKSCVSTYRAKSGHCVMKTSCKGVSLSGYEFGLVCVEASNKKVRHLFGEDSFDDEETFDTLIRCKECLALDAPQRASLDAKGGDLAKLVASVEDLTKTAEVMTGSIAKLEKEVFNKTTVKKKIVGAASEKAKANGTAAPANDTATGGPAPAPSTLLHHSVRRHSRRATTSMVKHTRRHKELHASARVAKQLAAKAEKHVAPTVTMSAWAQGDKEGSEETTGEEAAEDQKEGEEIAGEEAEKDAADSGESVSSSSGSEQEQAQGEEKDGEETTAEDAENGSEDSGESASNASGSEKEEAQGEKKEDEETTGEVAENGASNSGESASNASGSEREEADGATKSGEEATGEVAEKDAGNSDETASSASGSEQEQADSAASASGSEEEEAQGEKKEGEETTGEVAEKDAGSSGESVSNAKESVQQAADTEETSEGSDAASADEDSVTDDP